MNIMHANIEITDEFYSNLNDGEVQNRIKLLGKEKQLDNENQNVIDLFKEFLIWMEKRKVKQ